MNKVRILPIRPNGVRCVANPYAAHGEGHNAVCVCNCRVCRDERAGPASEITGEQYALALAAA